MCLIIFKKSTSKYDHEYISQCIKNSSVKNNSGFGFAVKNKEDIFVAKGYKNTKSFLKALEYYYRKGFFDGKDLVIHLRNASPNTSISLKTTHPIISDKKENLEKKVYTKNSVVVHNGFISDFRWDLNSCHSYHKKDEDTSDTVLFTEKYLSRENDFLFMNYMIKNYSSRFDVFYKMYTGNKMIIMKAGYTTLKINNFIESKSHKGYLFSNDSYRDSFRIEFLEDLERAREKTKTKSTFRTNSRIGNNFSNNNSNTDDYKLHSNDDVSKKRQYSLALNNNPFLYRNWSKSVEITDEDNPMSDSEVRFYYRSKDLGDTFSSQLLTVQDVPFKCLATIVYAKPICPLHKNNKESCCNNVKDARITTLRQNMLHFFTRRSYLNTDVIQKMDQSLLDIINAIDKSSQIKFYHFECPRCLGKNTFMDLKYTKETDICTNCNGLGVKMGLCIDLSKGNVHKYHKIDGITISHDIMGNCMPISHNEKVNVNDFISDLTEYIIKKSKIKIEGKNTKSSTAQVSAE